MKKNRILIGFAPEFLEAVDKAIEKSTFVTRTEFVKFCVRQELIKRGFST